MKYKYSEKKLNNNNDGYNQALKDMEEKLNNIDVDNKVGLAVLDLIRSKLINGKNENE